MELSLALRQLAVTPAQIKAAFQWLEHIAANTQFRSAIDREVASQHQPQSSGDSGNTALMPRLSRMSLMSAAAMLPGWIA